MRYFAGNFEEIIVAPSKQTILYVINLDCGFFQFHEICNKSFTFYICNLVYNFQVNHKGVIVRLISILMTERPGPGREIYLRIISLF